jgi:mannose-6-phosphate isomerase-like protein (cupin superfamily)
MSEIHQDDLESVLEQDGVPTVIAHDMANRPTTSLDALRAQMGDGSWATRLVYNERFGGVLIQQQPGEGNRLHYHPDADECWVILKGRWEWYIDGEGKKTVGVNDIVVVPKGVKHQITCVGDEPGIRFAITAPDVDHVYAGD